MFWGNLDKERRRRPQKKMQGKGHAEMKGKRRGIPRFPRKQKQQIEIHKKTRSGNQNRREEGKKLRPEIFPQRERGNQERKSRREGRLGSRIAIRVGSMTSFTITTLPLQLTGGGDCEIGGEGETLFLEKGKGLADDRHPHCDAWRNVKER